LVEKEEGRVAVSAPAGLHESPERRRAVVGNGRPFVAVAHGLGELVVVVVVRKRLLPREDLPEYDTKAVVHRDQRPSPRIPSPPVGRVGYL
jgi:hypothetical protein